MSSAAHDKEVDGGDKHAERQHSLPVLRDSISQRYLRVGSGGVLFVYVIVVKVEGAMREHRCVTCSLIRPKEHSPIRSSSNSVVYVAHTAVQPLCDAISQRCDRTCGRIGVSSCTSSC